MQEGLFTITPLKYDGLWRFLLVWLLPHILLIRTLNQCSQTVPSLTPPPLKKNHLVKYPPGTVCHSLLVSHPFQEPRNLHCQIALLNLPVWFCFTAWVGLRVNRHLLLQDPSQSSDSWGSAAGLICSGSAQSEREGKVRRNKRLGVLSSPLADSDLQHNS